jgi:hypothetical protein
MSYFRTVVSPGSSPQKMGISDRILTIGSCFADAIGTRLQQNRLKVLANPFGNLYNPHSIHKAIRYALYNELPVAHTFLSRDGICFNYDFHSEVSDVNQLNLSTKLKEITGAAHYHLAASEWIIITYGTAWVYERKESGEIVANCHKIPNTNFVKSLLSQQEITDSFGKLHNELKKFNPGIKIIVTVSPVRHIKDTLELNSVSKAVLRAACHTMVGTFSDVSYFPSYEVMLDDLRDYRFYKADMIHPSDVAEDYIWEKFGETYFTQDVKTILSQWNEIQRAINHRPFHPASPAHQSFLKETLTRLESLKGTIDVENEVALIKSQIENIVKT